MEMISVPSIIVVVFSIVELLKLTFKKFPTFTNFISLVSALVGAICGLIIFYAFPSIVPTDNVFHSILMGLFDGLSATGSQQLVIQIKDLINAKKINRITKETIKDKMEDKINLTE